MLFQATLTIPPDTPESDQVSVRLPVSSGITDYVFVCFPPGPRALARVSIWYHSTQLWPFTPGEYFEWDGYVFAFRDRIVIEQEPLELVVRGWNEDDSFEHKITFMVTIDPAPDVQELRQLRRSLEMLGLVRTPTP